MSFTTIDVPISDLRPYANNPRLNDAAVHGVADSIREYGFRVPLVITPEYEIICGHTRWKAAHKLKLEKVPCHVATDLTPEQIRAYRLIDNKSAEVAEWDTDLLLEELLAVKDNSANLSDWFDDLNQSSQKKDKRDPDAAPELPDAPQSKPGETYQLGNHRLTCGDSTDPAIIKRLLGGEKARVCFTDPPYNMAYKSKIHGGIKNDALADADFTRLVLASLGNMRENLTDGGAYYVCMGQAAYALVALQMRRIGLDHRLIVWCKESLGLGAQEYRPKFELILYGSKGKKGLVFNGERKESDLWENTDFTRGLWTRETEDGGMVIEIEHEQGSRQIFLEKKSAGTVIEQSGASDDLWHYSREASNNYVHPTQKPVSLIEKALKLSSNDGDIVLDIFGGSGSTLIAAERTGRKAYLCELDPKYCDVIRKRYAEYTYGNGCDWQEMKQ